MSNPVMLLADILVAVLLGATIISSVRLSKRIAGLKADETAMRQTIGDLVAATGSAERAIGGLRAALDECDRTLAERLEAGSRVTGELAAKVAAGESVVARIGAIVVQAQGAGQGAASAASRGAWQEAGQNAAPRSMHGLEHGSVQAVRSEPRPAPPFTGPSFASLREPAAALPIEPLSSGERINATLAAARALSERALERARARAA